LKLNLLEQQQHLQVIILEVAFQCLLLLKLPAHGFSLLKFICVPPLWRFLHSPTLGQLLPISTLQEHDFLTSFPQAPLMPITLHFVVLESYAHEPSQFHLLLL